MVAQKVSIKGIRDGLLVTLGADSYGEALQHLAAELSRKQRFLAGSQIVLQVDERPLQQEQVTEIQTLFERHGLTLRTVLAEQESTRAAVRQLGLATRLSGSRTNLSGNIRPEAEEEDRNRTVSPHTRSEGVMFRETVRSGQSVFHEGHIVVIGDVNPGAELIAGGDVVVWGRLRGLVHAGAQGDETAVICALELSPTQLRIANQIAVPPDEPQARVVPERAVIRSGRIVAEPWTPRDPQIPRN